MTDRLLRQLLEWRDYEYCEGEQPYELLTNAVDYAHDLLTTANTYKAKVAELEALARNYRESWNGAQIDVQGLLARERDTLTEIAEVACMPFPDLATKDEVVAKVVELGAERDDYKSRWEQTGCTRHSAMEAAIKIAESRSVKIAELEAEKVALGRVPLTESQANKMYARLQAAESRLADIAKLPDDWRERADDMAWRYMRCADELQAALKEQGND